VATLLDVRIMERRWLNGLVAALVGLLIALLAVAPAAAYVTPTRVAAATYKYDLSGPLRLVQGG
jgi:hypothetical protein